MLTSDHADTTPSKMEALMRTDNAGIDYSLGTSNVDTETGIRYGVISQYSVGQAWYDSAEPDYPEPENDEDEQDDTAEPIGWSFEDAEYTLTDCLDTDIMILKSPFYTFAQFCSPCVPDAANLDSPCDSGVKAYCLGHDWFEDNKAPYTVYRVTDGSVVNPE